MDIFSKILILLGGIALGYLIGSLSFALIIGKTFYKKDVRLYGSKNAGGTNATRVLGRKGGFLVIFLDVLKAIVVYWTITLILMHTALGNIAWAGPTVYAAIIATALGHAFPIFYGFKGGKVVSIFVGFALATNWLVTIVSITIFFGMIGWKKMVSLGSVLTSVAFMLYGWIFIFPSVANLTMYAGTIIDMVWFYIAFAFISVLLVVRHRDNIKRIFAGTERRIGEPRKN